MCWGLEGFYKFFRVVKDGRRWEVVWLFLCVRDEGNYGSVERGSYVRLNVWVCVFEDDG